jgi:hypothetical protein
MQYTWIISSMDCKVQEGEMTDVVQTVHWRYKATEIIFGTSGSDDKTYTAETYGASSFGEPTPENFTDYNNLTETQVVGWLEGILDVPEMQINLTEQINLEITPVNVTLPPPF